MVKVKLGERVYACAKEQSWASYLTAIATLTLFICWVPLLIVLTFLAILGNLYARIVLVVLFLTVLLPAQPLNWQRFLKSWVLSTWRDYFSFSYLLESHEPEKDYIFAEFPHGCFPMGPLVGASYVHEIWPGHRIFGLAASGLFYVPFYRHFFSWIGCRPATKDNLCRLAKKGSVAIIVGGIAEMFMIKKHEEQILLKGRFGFVKAAVETGIDIVPVYYFGNSQILNFGPEFLAPLSRKLRLSIGWIYGVLGLPIPRKVELFMVVGRIVKVGSPIAQGAPGYEAQVAKVHADVVAELHRMYDANKTKYGWSSRPLQIK